MLFRFVIFILSGINSAVYFPILVLEMIDKRDLNTFYCLICLCLKTCSFSNFYIYYYVFSFLISSCFIVTFIFQMLICLFSLEILLISSLLSFILSICPILILYPIILFSKFEVNLTFQRYTFIEFYQLFIYYVEKQ